MSVSLHSMPLPMPRTPHDQEGRKRCAGRHGCCPGARNATEDPLGFASSSWACVLVPRCYHASDQRDAMWSELKYCTVALEPDKHLGRWSKRNEALGDDRTLQLITSPLSQDSHENDLSHTSPCNRNKNYTNGSTLSPTTIEAPVALCPLAKAVCTPNSTLPSNRLIFASVTKGS